MRNQSADELISLGSIRRLDHISTYTNGYEKTPSSDECPKVVAAEANLCKTLPVTKCLKDTIGQGAHDARAVDAVL